MFGVGSVPVPAHRWYFTSVSTDWRRFGPSFTA